MASSSPKPSEREETISGLKKRIEEEEKNILPAFQALVRQVHVNYKETLDQLMASTNGQILHRLQIFPSIVTYSSQMIADHDVNSYVLASPSAIKGLLMTSLRTVTMGLEDLNGQCEMMLSGDELKRFKVSKLRRAATDELLRKEYLYMVNKLSGIQVQLALLQKKPRKNDRKSTYYVNYMPTDVAALHNKPKQAVIDLEAHLLYLLRNQFNYMFFEFNLLVTYDNPLMKSLGQDHQAKYALSILHRNFSAIPDRIEPAQHEKYIKELSAGVDKLRELYRKARNIALEAVEKDLAASNSRNQKYPVDKELLISTAGGLKADDFAHKAFDCRVAWTRDEIKRYGSLIERMEEPSWDENMRELSIKEAKERKEKLVQDLMKLERGRCDITGCSCVEDEKTANAAASGSGTETRNRADRLKVEELLTGQEPWKEKMDAFTKMLEEEREGFM